MYLLFNFDWYSILLDILSVRTETGVGEGSYLI